MYQYSLNRIAHRRPRGFGVENNVRRHFQVSRIIHIHMAVAHTGLDYRHMRILHHSANQPRTAAGNQYIQIPGQPHHFNGGSPAGILHQLDAVTRQSGGFHCVPHHFGNSLIGAERLFSASENHRVSCLQAQCCRVGGHIGTGLIDDANHAQRDGDFLNAQTIGPHAAFQHLSHRVRLGLYLPHTVSHACNALFIQRQPVHQRTGHTILFRREKVFPVCSQNFFRMCLQRGSNGLQRCVLLISGNRQFSGRLLCSCAHFFQSCHFCASLT